MSERDTLAAHEPGEEHRYDRPVCVVCGQHGQIVLSIEPQRATPAPPAEIDVDWHHRCDIPACNCGRCHQCGEDMPDPMDRLR